MRRSSVLAVLLVVVLAAAAPAQDRARGKEIVIGLGAEPRTLLAVTTTVHAPMNSASRAPWSTRARRSRPS